MRKEARVTLDTEKAGLGTDMLSGDIPTNSPTVVIARDLCKGCGFCIDACPPKVLAEADGLNIMGYHPVFLIGEGCTGCGICFYACPEPGAIIVYKNARR